MTNDRQSSRACWQAPAGCCIALVLLAQLVPGCAPKPPAALDKSVPGEYALVSVDGKQVPCVVKHEGADMAIQSGAFTFNADGTCRSRIVLKGGKEQGIVREARYTCEGSKLTMRWRGAGTTVGEIAGDTFTMANEGMTFVYRKTGP